MPLPTPKPNEKESEFISRCVSFIFREGTLHGKKMNPKSENDRKQATAVCYNQWRNRKMNRELYSFDIENDGAIKWSQPIYMFSEGETENFIKCGSTCLIGDRFYKGKFLAFSEIEKAYLSMNKAFHDINHWGTTHPLTGQPNLEWIIGYQDGTTINKTTKQMTTDIYINKSAPKFDVWKNYVDICKKANRVPNVSVSFWADMKEIPAKDLPVNCSEYGYNDDDIVQYLHNIEFQALSTVFRGACDDKTGCGIGIGYNLALDATGTTIPSNWTVSSMNDDTPVDPNINNINKTTPKTELAKWDRKYINDLPDAAFAYIEPGGEKDEEGKTVPRSLRHFPHHTMNVKSGKEHDTVDKPHLRNALARVPQSPFGAKAKPHLIAHAKALGIGDYTSEDKLTELNEQLKKEIELKIKKYKLL
jgi:hypothetical protein